MIQALVLIGVAAFAATAANMTSPSKGPTDIALAPAPVRTLEARPVDDRPGAPLFTTGASSVAATRLEPATPEGIIAGGTLPTGALDARLERGGAARDRVEDRLASSAGRRRSGAGSDSRIFSGVGGAAAWGGVSGSATRSSRASGEAAVAASQQSSGAEPASQASESRRSQASGESRSERASSESEEAAESTDVQPHAATPGRGSSQADPGGPWVAAGSPVGSSPSPASAPEPLTLLLVGTGLAGLYGMRKHLS